MPTSIHTPHRHPVALEPGLVAGVVETAPAPVAARRRLSSQALLGNEREIEIEHAGQLYRLRLTSLGKLILTK